MKNDKTEIKSNTERAENVSHPLPVIPAKSKRWLWIALSAIGLLVVAGVALYTLAAKTPAPETKNDQFAAATRFASAQALIDEVKPELEGTVLLTDEVDGVGAVNAEGYGVYSPPIYQVPGKKYLSLPTQQSGSGYSGDSVAAEENYKKLVRFFDTHHFSLVTKSENGVGSISTNEKAAYVTYAEYESANLLCAIRHVDASGSSLQSHVSSVGCAEKTSYEASAEAAQAFYDVYVKEQFDVQETVFGQPVVTDGAEGYQRASLYQEDATQFGEGEEVRSFYGLYFKAPQSSKWEFFTGVLTDEIPDCSEFSNVNLRKAFKDVECYDSTTQKDSLVQ